MKILGLLCFLIFQSCFAKDLAKINQSIDTSQAQIQNNPYDVRIVVQAFAKFDEFLPLLQKCIADESKEIIQFSKEVNSLNRISNSEFVLKEKENRLKLLYQHQDSKSFCEFMLLKINRLQNQLSSSNQKLYQEELFNKQVNIFKAFSQFDEPIVRKSPVNSGFTQYIKQSNAIISMRLIFIILLVFIFFKILNITKFNNNAFLKKLSIQQYFKVIIVFIVLAPVQYILLKTIYSHHDEFLLNLFHAILVQVMLIGFIIYVYFFYKTESIKKDLFLVFGHVIIISNIIWGCFEINYLLIHDFSSQEILVKKYLLLIFLQPIIYSVAYWSFRKILKFNIYFKYVPWLFFIFTSLVFILGLIGYVDLAVNLDFIIILNSIFIVWLFIMNFLKNSLWSIFDEPQHSMYQYLEKVFQERLKLAILNIKMMSFILYFFSIFFLVFGMVVLSSSFIPTKSLQNLYLFFYSQKNVGFFSFTIARIIQSIVLFYLLNLVNYGLSQYVAKKLFQEKISQQKTTNLLNWFGYMLSILIVLKFVGFNLQNFLIIFGGLSLGLGLGLKDLLSSLISSVILFINRPFKIGDYIEIGQTKGHVKKVSLLETTIETADSNTLILPNQYVASSVIQNFTYENKAFQKVHVNYTINNLNIDKEEDIKIKILEELRENPYLLESPHHVINIAFSLLEQATDVFRLEIIFFLREQIDIKEEMTKINRKIHERLKKMHLDIHYENMQYPYK